VNFIKVFSLFLVKVWYSFSCLVRLLAWLLVVNYFCFFIVAACLFTLCSTLFHSSMEPDNTPNNLMILGKVMLLQIGLTMSIWYSGYVHFNKWKAWCMCFTYVMATCYPYCRIDFVCIFVIVMHTLSLVTLEPVATNCCLNVYWSNNDLLSLDN
jgi:hypothetical protein